MTLEPVSENFQCIADQPLLVLKDQHIVSDSLIKSVFPVLVHRQPARGAEVADAGITELGHRPAGCGVGIVIVGDDQLKVSVRLVEDAPDGTDDDFRPVFGREKNGEEWRLHRAAGGATCPAVLRWGRSPSRGTPAGQG